jgi:hypothetical protein
MGDFTPTPPGATGSNPSSTTGSYNPWKSVRSSTAPVFMGYNQGAYVGGNYGTGGSPMQYTNKYYSKSGANSLYDGFTKAERDRIDRIYKASKAAGFTGRSAKALWSAAVDQAAAAEESALSPWDFLRTLEGNLAAGRGFGSASGGAGGGGGRTSTTSRSYQKTNADQGGRILDDVLASYLGRTASDAEKANFMKRINAEEAKTPVNVSTSTASGTTSRSNSGVDVAARAQQMAESQGDYAEYQYATTYYDAFLSALGSPVEGV